MKKPPALNRAELKLPLLTPAQAEAQEFTTITTGISPDSEAFIIRDMDKTLSTCSACWIVFPDGTWEAGRRKRGMKGLYKDLGYLPTAPGQKKTLPPKHSLSPA